MVFGVIFLKSLSVNLFISLIAIFIFDTRVLLLFLSFVS